MTRSQRYFSEVQERAVRVVMKAHGRHELQWAATMSIAAKVGCTTEARRCWVRLAERDGWQREGVTTA